MTNKTIPDKELTDILGVYRDYPGAVLRARSAVSIVTELIAARGRFAASIVCMCGSTKFKQTWITENARLTGEGNIVLAVGLWGHHERVFPDEQTKTMLDDLHKRKIDLCDWVWVLDVGGYIGDSTRSEIAYAKKLGRPIRYLSEQFPDYQEPGDPLDVARDKLQRVGEVLSRRRTRQPKMSDSDVSLLSQKVSDLLDNIDEALRILAEEPAKGKK